MEEEVMAKTSLEVEAFRCFLLALVLLFAFDFSILMWYIYGAVFY